MPTLEWIGKNKVINHHQEVPFRTLERKYSYDENGEHIEDNGSNNMIIHGDNLEALKALLPKYKKQIKCIYIDPPYNTGNEGWIYNDNVNDPKIKQWLGESVGKEGDDLTRHDKWLCMMYPRLKILNKLLTTDGCLIISISHHELHNLVNLLNEIFSTKQVVVVTVQTSGGKPSKGFNYVHEYLVFVVPTDFKANELDFCGGNNRTPYEGLTLSTFDKTQRPNQVYPIFIDENGTLVGVGKSLQEQINDGTYCGKKEDFNYNYSIAPQGTVAVWPVTSKGKQCVWRQIPERIINDWKKGYIKISPQKNKKNKNKYSIQYLPSGVIQKIETGKLKILGHEEGAPTLLFGNNETAGRQIPTIWMEKQFFTTNGTQILKEIFPDTQKAFDYPKSPFLIESIIQAITKDNDIILDSFAGSGTTAHAILNMNKADGGNRRFILIEMMDYANTITAQRVKRVISGYQTEKKSKEIIYDKELSISDLQNGTELIEQAKLAAADAESYYDNVSKPQIKNGHLQVIATKSASEKISGIGGNFSYYELGEPLLVEGKLNKSVGTEKIREYIWHTETEKTYSHKINKNPYYLGTNNHIAYYFYYESNRICLLDHAFLATINKKADGYVIYADRCSLSDAELLKFGITFKKIPRDITQM